MKKGTKSIRISKYIQGMRDFHMGPAGGKRIMSVCKRERNDGMEL